MMRPTVILIAALALAGCASSGGANAGDTTVLQWIDITNQTSEPVVVTARVGASPQESLGFFGPAEYRRVRISTGAATTDEVYLEAHNDNTGNHATTTLKVTPGQTLRWDIRF